MHPSTAGPGTTAAATAGHPTARITRVGLSSSGPREGEEAVAIGVDLLAVVEAEDYGSRYDVGGGRKQRG